MHRYYLVGRHLQMMQVEAGTINWIMFSDFSKSAKINFIE